MIRFNHRRPSGLHRAGTTTLSLVAGLLLSSCHGSDSPTTPQGRSVTDASHMQQYCDIPTPDCPAPPPDPTDTQVSADVTYSAMYTATLSEYFTDPVSGRYTNVLSVTAADVPVHVDAGYDYTGQVRIATSYSDGVDGTTAVMPQITNEDLAGDNLTDINTYGYSLVTSTPDSLQAAPALDLVGSTANGDITAGLLVNTADTLVSSQSAVAAGNVTMSASRLPLPGGANGSEPAVAPATAFARAAFGMTLATRLLSVPVHIRGTGNGTILVEDDPAGDAAGVMRQSAPSADAKGEKHTRKYKKLQDSWVLTEDRSESTTDDAHGHHQTVTVAAFKNVTFHRNKLKDARRRALRPTTDWISRGTTHTVGLQRSPVGSPSLSRSSLRVPDHASRMVICGDECAGTGYSPPSGPQPMGFDPLCFNDIAATVNTAPASVNILYQHGFGSSARTWCRMSRYVRERFRVGNEIRHTLDPKASYEDQAGDLESRFRPDVVQYPGPYVLVGHSNGGLVNRYMAQQVSDPSLIRGVVTVSSPHAGIYLANITERVLIGALAIPISSYYFGCDMANAFVCSHGAGLATQVVAAVGPILASAAYPVLQEMGTDAAFHNTINGRGDAAYRVAGVQNRAWDRWTMWRLLADFQRCPEGYIECDAYSRTYVNAIDKNYHHFIKCAVVSGLFGIIFPGARQAAVVCAKNAAFLRVSDAAYKRLTVGSGHGDGVVPEFSQMYPGASPLLQFLVDDSDSHLGETRSRRTSQGVIRAINVGMGIPFDQ